MRFRPHQYQQDVLDRMLDTDKLALLLDPGMGKTAVCLEDFRIRKDLLVARRALVVAPLRVCYSTWPAEVRKWTNFRDITIHVAHGKGKDLIATNAADIVVINPEGLKWLLENQEDVFPFDVLYVDESTLFKNSQSKRSKALYKIAHRMHGGIPYRFILTGTPAPNGVGDLFGQFKVLSPKILGDTLKKFRTVYGFMPYELERGVIWKPTKYSETAIAKDIKPYSIRLDATDHLDLPDIQYVRRPVRLDKKSMRLYKELEKELYIDVKAGKVVAVNAAVATSKCRQVANGAVYVTKFGDAYEEECRMIEWMHTAKVEDLCDFYEELGQKPVIVTYEFKHDLVQIKLGIKERFGFVPRYIGETTDAEEDNKLIEQWNAKDLPMLLINPASVSHGLNLQAGGHHLYWYSQIWDLDKYKQLNARLWRQGQSEGVFVHHAVAENTVDEKAYKARLKKDATQLSLLYALK